MFLNLRAAPPFGEPSRGHIPGVGGTEAIGGNVTNVKFTFCIVDSFIPLTYPVPPYI